MKQWLYGVFILSFSFMVSVIYDAYSIKAQTRIEQEKVKILIDKLVEERHRLVILRAEWAYLNNPQRLETLLQKYGQDLGLTPVQGKQLLVDPAPFMPVSLPLEVKTNLFQKY